MGGSMPGINVTRVNRSGFMDVQAPGRSKRRSLVC